ncbi:MAG: hypothetical protein CMJ70_26980 [Planctomycetaceae bacterium]|nr:hypothetical protein [Planctomycetaceae bacterium]
MLESTSIAFRTLLNADPELEELLRLGLSDGTLKLINMAAEHGFEFVAWISQEEARKREQPDRVAQRPVSVQYRRRRRRSRTDDSENGIDTNHENGNGNGTNGHRRRRNGETRSSHGEGRRRRRITRDRDSESKETREVPHRNGGQPSGEIQPDTHHAEDRHFTGDTGHEDVLAREPIADTNGEARESYQTAGDTNGEARESYQAAGDTNGEARESYQTAGDTNGEARESHEPFGDSDDNGKLSHDADSQSVTPAEAITPDQARPRRTRRSVRRRSPTGTTSIPVTQNGHNKTSTDENRPAGPSNSLPTKLW